MKKITAREDVRFSAALAEGLFERGKGHLAPYFVKKARRRIARILLHLEKYEARAQAQGVLGGFRCAVNAAEQKIFGCMITEEGATAVMAGQPLEWEE